MLKNAKKIGKSNKGVTLISIVIYIMVLIAIIGVIATMKSNIDAKVNSMDDYISVVPHLNTLHMYMLKEANIDNNQVVKRSATGDYIEFSSGNKYFFSDNKIYKNGVRVLSDVEACSFNIIKENNNFVLSANIGLIGNVELNKELKYVLKTQNADYSNVSGYENVLKASLDVTDIDNTSFTLTANGTDFINGIQKYEFYIDDVLVHTENTSAETFSYNVTGKTNGTTYICKVRVYNTVGERTSSNLVSVTCGRQGVYAILYTDGLLNFNNTGKLYPGKIDNDVVVRSGDISQVNFGNYSDVVWYNNRASITTVNFETKVKPVSTANWFNSANNLTNITNIQKLDTSNVKYFENMFYKCYELTSIDVSGFNTTNAINMSYMFGSCKKITSIDVSGFNTTNAINMSWMFSYCSSLTNLNVSSFNTSKVRDMVFMFCNCSKLINLDVSNFDTRNVTSMVSMFQACTSLTSLDVSNFDTRNVTSMAGMFQACTSLTSLDVSNFNTSKVTDMASMFCGTGNAAQTRMKLTSLDVTNFDTSNVTSMNGMFQYCNSLTSLDVSNFNTSKVTDMTSMFGYCGSLTSLDVSSFVTNKVTGMGNMFNHCGKLTTLDMTNFDTTNVRGIFSMFSGCTDLKTIYVSDLWTNAAVTDSSKMFYGSTNLVGAISWATTEPNDKTNANCMSEHGYFTPKLRIALTPTTPGAISVNVKILAPQSSNSIQYKIGSGEWTNYTQGVNGFDITQNQTIYARFVDGLGNTFGTTSITISNIT